MDGTEDDYLWVPGFTDIETEAADPIPVVPQDDPYDDNDDVAYEQWHQLFVGDHSQDSDSD